MSRRGENIFKRKDGRWEGRYKSGVKANGRAKYSSVYAKSYADCATKLRAERDRQGLISNPMSIDDLFNAWLSSRKNSIKQSTFASYKKLYSNYLCEPLGNYRADSVTALMINELVDRLLTYGGKREGGLSAVTVQSILILLKSVFEYGAIEYMLNNPAKNVAMPKCEVKDIRIFSDEEVSKIRYAAIAGDSCDLGILLSLYTGIRIGELCALTWGDIDVDNGLISVSKTLCRITNPHGEKPKSIVVITPPKSKKSLRDILIPPFILPRIIALKHDRKDSDYFLTGSQKYIEPRSYSHKYKRFLEKTSVPYKNFHVLRHTFATTCIKQGIDVKTVSELLGHSGVKITLEKYVHSDLDMKRRQLEKLYSAL